MAKEPRHFINEADIGSGEKTAEQKDIESEAQTIPARAPESSDPRSHSDNAAGTFQHPDERPPLDSQPIPAAQQDQSLGSDNDGSRVLQQGSHIARITTAQLPDGTFEAQVYLRLTREPEIAETYVPAGTFPSEEEAWAAAEARANRAFNEDEF